MNTAINFIKDTIDTTQVTNLYGTIRYESLDMEKAGLDVKINKLDDKIKKEDGTYTVKQVEAFKEEREEVAKELKKCEEAMEELKATHELVLSEMTTPNEKGFSNPEYAVRNVLRVVASAGNGALSRYAFIDKGKDKDSIFTEELMKAMDYVADIEGKRLQKEGAGNATQGKKLKDQYKKAEYEVGVIVREMFSLPIATPYTEPLRVKFNNADLHLLHKLYVTGFKNKMEEVAKGEEKELRFVKREVSTLISKTINKKTKDVTPKFGKFSTELVKLAVAYMVKHK